MDVPSGVNRVLDLALELKAHGLVVLDLRGICTATDFFVLASGTSDVQVRAIAEHVVEKLKVEGIRPGHVEGIRGGRWILLDYIDFVVHVLRPEARIFYQLEDLWGDAPRWDVSHES
ncbi:MAG TPA: ribosome silencing factor [Gemmatimonadetes bacterium]|nr:ribosome silencing factor [Gemmatimonadota bacterium]HIL89050.1 ribosome silencing factor [Gemmatimonadota bacterium]